MTVSKLILGMDFETTGFKHQGADRIIEICMILFEWDGSSLKYKDSLVTLINPRRDIPDKITEITGISNKDVVGADFFEDHAAKVQELLGKSDLVVAHNVNFDLPFVESELQRVGRSVDVKQAFCTMTESKHWAKSDCSQPKLGDLCFTCRVKYDVDKAHAAKYDVLKMMQCFVFGVKNKLFKVEDL